MSALWGSLTFRMTLEDEIIDIRSKKVSYFVIDSLIASIPLVLYRPELL